MLNALSFDIEDYFHVHAFDGVISRDDWDRIPTRVVESTRLILQLLFEHDTRATFFVLGWVAERHPEIVREIAANGHELASHGYAHESVCDLTPDLFYRDVKRSIDAIVAACPTVTVQGYRAPSFSIDENSRWAFDVLSDMGLVYDSSVFPTTFHDRYGMHSSPRFAHRVGPALWEIPLSTIRALGCNFAVAGGGYFRLMPLSFTAWAMRKINREGQPVVVYLHPWEFDPDQPRVLSARWRSKFRHYVNLRRTERKLRQLLKQFSFGPIGQVFHESLCKTGNGAIITR